MKKTSIWFLLIGVFALILSGCTHKQEHTALHGIYYGYYSDGDPQNFLILAFSKNQPDQVGFRQNHDGSKLDSVFEVSYGKNSVTLHAPEKSITMIISKDNKILTCPTCNGINGPRTFSDTDNNGKLFAANVGDIAYESISKNAKSRGTYLQKIKEAK